MSSYSLNFEQIVLSNSQVRQLKKSAKTKIELSKCTELKSLCLVDEEKTGKPGYRPEPTGFVVINQTGREYLAYINRRNREHRITRWLSIIALVISAISLLMQAWK